MNRTILMAGAMLLVASCGNAADPNAPSAEAHAEQWAIIDAKLAAMNASGTSSEDRLWNQPENVQRRAKICASLQEKGETRPWC